MKKSNIFTHQKGKNFRWQLLFRVSFVVFFSIIFVELQAQCPTVTAAPSSAIICSGTKASIVLTSDQMGTAYSWTAVQNDVAGASDGAGTAIECVLASTDELSGSAVYTITPIANGCKGRPVTIVFIVNPTPDIVAAPLTSTISSGSNTSIVLTSNTAETSFSWTVIRSGVTGASTGSGSVISQKLTTAAESGIVTYCITPNFKGCLGKPIDAKVIVKKHF